MLRARRSCSPHERSQGPRAVRNCSARCFVTRRFDVRKPLPGSFFKKRKTNKWRNMHLTVVMTHGPSTHKGKHSQKTCWTLHRQTAFRVPKDRRLALLIDANGRVGSPGSKQIGGGLGDIETPSGCELRLILVERTGHRTVAGASTRCVWAKQLTPRFFAGE